MTSSRGAVRSPLAVLALVSALALAGCGGDDAPDPAASTEAPSPAASGSSEASGETSGGTESSETAEATPSESDTAASVPPAAGPVMQLDDMSINAPEGWEIGQTGGSNQGAFNASGGPGAMTVTLLGAVPGESFESTFDGTFQTMTSDGLKPERLEDITLDGVQAWVVSGSSKGVALEYSVGGLAGSDTFSITFQYLTEPPPDVQTTIDGVLASVVFAAA